MMNASNHGASCEHSLTELSELQRKCSPTQRTTFNPSCRISEDLSPSTGHATQTYFSFQPVLHDLCNKARGMCYPLCGMVHIKEPLLLIEKSSPYGGSGFPLSLSEWSFTICLTLNKIFPSFIPQGRPTNGDCRCHCTK